MAQNNTNLGDFGGNTQKILNAVGGVVASGVDPLTILNFPSAAIRQRMFCLSHSSLGRT